MLQEYILEALKDNFLVAKETTIILYSGYDLSCYLVNHFVAKMFHFYCMYYK